MLKDRHLVLIGFMASGKTTIGQLLAERLERLFIDLDDWICRRVGMTIPEYFDQHGEKAFRRVESELLGGVLKESPSVIALGGGAFCSPENREMIRSRGVSVWLDIPFELAAERCLGDDSRPLARDPGRFRRLFDDRLSLYAKADLRIDAGIGTPREVRDEVVRSALRDQFASDSGQS